MTATRLAKKARTKAASGVPKVARSADGIISVVRSDKGMVDVLTLAEAAKYLRVSETAVLQAIDEQNLPARRVGKDWRILKSAIQQWLLAPQTRRTGKAVLQSLAGVWKGDPSVEPMLAEIYRQRGRSMVEEST